jgi:hypothetical protein
MHGRLWGCALTVMAVLLIPAPGALGGVPARDVPVGVYHGHILLCCDVYFVVSPFSAKGISNKTNPACIKRNVGDGGWFAGRALLTGSRTDNEVVLTFQYPDEAPFDMFGSYIRQGGFLLRFRNHAFHSSFEHAGRALPADCPG